MTRCGKYVRVGEAYALDGDDTSHDAARELIGAWVDAGTLRLISLVNLTEVLVGLAGDPTLLRIGRESLRIWSIRSHAPTEAVAVDAARLRAAHAISLPDASYSPRRVTWTPRWRPSTAGS